MKKHIKKLRIWHISVFLIILLILIVLFAKKGSEPFDLFEEEEMVIRESAVAGSWYPGTESGASGDVEKYLNAAEDENIDNIRALIVPHAGWRFSGEVAGAGFNQLKDELNL